jgi:hypothetical protein
MGLFDSIIVQLLIARLLKDQLCVYRLSIAATRMARELSVVHFRPLVVKTPTISLAHSWSNDFSSIKLFHTTIGFLYERCQSQKCAFALQITGFLAEIARLKPQLARVGASDLDSTCFETGTDQEKPRSEVGQSSLRIPTACRFGHNSRQCCDNRFAFLRVILYVRIYFVRSWGIVRLNLQETKWCMKRFTHQSPNGPAHFGINAPQASRR